MNTNTTFDPLVDQTQLGEYIEASHVTLKRWRDNLNFPAYVQGNAFRYRIREVLTWAQENGKEKKILKRP